MSDDERFYDLPNYDTGWNADDWRQVFIGHGNESAIEWRTIGVPGEVVKPILPIDVAQIEHVWTRCNQDYADSSIAAVMSLNDGSYAALVAWADSSGWGCVDAVHWRFAPTKAEVVRHGLDNEARERLGLSL